jgi:hypothetical protein
MTQMQCPHCLSYRTEDRRRMFIGLGVFFAIGSIPFTWLILPIFVFVIGLGMIVYGLIIRSERIFCRSCGTRFSLTSV